jgi:hypothetical protein
MHTTFENIPSILQTVAFGEVALLGRVLTGLVYAAATGAGLPAMETPSFNLQETQITRFKKRVKEIYRLHMRVAKYYQPISLSIQVATAAGIVVSKMGTAVPTPAEILSA